jgi:AcrR family transcriptional regulator
MPARRAAPVAAPRRPRGRPRKTLAERDEGNRRRELIRAAARLFHRKGFAATSTRDIAAKAGMQSGSPFYHFKSKSALLHAVMEEGLRSAGQQQARALQALGADGTSTAAVAPDAALRALIRAHFDILLGPGSDFVPVMLYESRSLTPRQRADIAKLQREYEAHWMPVLQALRETGRLRTDVHLARLLILGALNWTVQWFDPKGPATLDDLTDAAMNLFLQE